MMFTVINKYTILTNILFTFYIYYIYNGLMDQRRIRK